MTTSIATRPAAPHGASTAVRLHEKAVCWVDTVVNRIRPDQWNLATPCAEWDLRALVEHLVAEARWTVPLLSGLTIEEVGATLDAPLDPDPLIAWTRAQVAARRAAGARQLGDVAVHLSSGRTPAPEYLRQLTADYLVHGWDIAITLGLDDVLDPELVSSVAGWFPAHAAAYGAAGMITAPTPQTDDDPQTRLLAMFGRDRAAQRTRAVITRFGLAFDRGDVDAVMDLMTTDCVFESTAPPDGRRHEGQAAVRGAWTEFFATTAAARFDTEEVIVAGDRVVVRWRYTWAAGAAGHVRGVDVFRIRDGLVAEKLSYVKG